MQQIAKREIETPLGAIETGTALREVAEPNRGAGACPVTGECTIEDKFPLLTDHFDVAEIRRASWRLAIDADVSGLRLYIRWLPGAMWTHRFETGGQHFEAIQYSGEACQVHIGSVDDGCLFDHAVQHLNGRPARFDELLDDDGWFIEDIEWLRRTEDGVFIDFPPLCGGETVEVVFTVVWAFEPTSDTHFAADAALGGDNLWSE